MKIASLLKIRKLSKLSVSIDYQIIEIEFAITNLSNGNMTISKKLAFIKKFTWRNWFYRRIDIFSVFFLDLNSIIVIKRPLGAL